MVRNINTKDLCDNATAILNAVEVIRWYIKDGMKEVKAHQKRERLRTDELKPQDIVSSSALVRDLDSIEGYINMIESQARKQIVSVTNAEVREDVCKEFGLPLTREGRMKGVFHE